MIKINDFTANFDVRFPQLIGIEPWEIVNQLEEIVANEILRLDDNYKIENGIAIHKTAIIEKGVTLKGAIIIGENCFIGAHAYLRGPIFLANSVIVGPSSEIKQAIILSNSTIAHFNFVGNSILGENINFEAGSICANHYNERQDKTIFVLYKDKIIDTKTIKFGALVGDNCRIGANAVLSPGTILEKNSVVKRLQLIEQISSLTNWEK